MSCMVTTHLICANVFAYTKSRFSHDAAHLVFQVLFVVGIGVGRERENFRNVTS